MNTITNNRISGLVGLLLGITTLFGLFGFTTPVSAASDVTCNSAVVSAWVDPQGSATTAWMQWGTSPSLSGSTFSSTPHTYNNYETISATATNLSENTTYYYRGRFNNASRGAWNGDIFSFTTLSCGGGNPPPTSLSCALDYNATPSPYKINKGVKFEAFGGNNSYAYVWHTDGGSSAGQFASQAWPSWSTSGTKHVSVTNNGQTANCTTVTIDNTPPASLSCAVDTKTTPAPHNINKGVKFLATGGDGSYLWQANGGSPSSDNGNQIWPSYTTGGTKYVTVSSGSLTANCSVYIETPIPAQKCMERGATNYGEPLPCTFPPPITYVCRDPSATNYLISYPCKYPPVIQKCQDPNAINYLGTLPCRYQIPTTYPTVDIAANPSSVAYNGSSTITWTSQNATSCSASGGTNGWSGERNISGNFLTGSLTNTATYNITCRNSAGATATDSVTVYVGNEQQNYPTVNISANPSSVNYGGASTVTWNSTNATYCSATGGSNGWSGGRNISGSFPTGSLISNTTYNIICYSSTGQQASDSVTVYVGNDNTGTGPDVTTRSATDINDNDAVLNGLVDGNGLSTRAWFEYGTSRNNLDEITSRNSYGSDSTNYNERISGLDEDTIYYFRAVAENSEDIVYGSTLSFRTDNGNNNNNDGPDVTTKNATNVDSNSATLNGRVDGNGLSTHAWFEYGTSRSLGYSTSQTSYGSGSSNYDKGISGLMPNTTYYFRAVAENSEDTAYGSILSFYTSSNFIIPPVTNQPTVVIYADSTNLAYNGATSIRWGTVNATSCYASGGSTGWAGQKSIGPASFYTGSLTGTRTYTITCTNNVGSATNSVTVNVRGRVITNPVIPTSYVIINSSVDRNQPIVPTLDNTRPRPGDEINYTVTYQNIGNASITNLSLRLDLPYEVDYMFSTPNNPIRNGNTLIFNLGTLKANAQGTVTVRVRVRENIPAGTNINFPAILSYIDPSGYPQSVNANVSAQIWSEPVVIIDEKAVDLGANVFGVGFLPTNLFGWLLLLIMILILVYLAKYLFGQPMQQPAFVTKKTTTTTVEH
jgi:uncharacterized repeat protein (TIGR01451 family)